MDGYFLSNKGNYNNGKQESYMNLVGKWLANWKLRQELAILGSCNLQNDM